MPSVFLALLLCGLGVSQPGRTAVTPDHAPVLLKNPVQDKNFYFFSLIERSPETSALLNEDPQLKALALRKRDAMQKAVKGCASDSACILGQFTWSEDEIGQVAQRLDVLSHNPQLQQTLLLSLRRSGLFVRYQAMPDSALLQQAWTDAAHGINHILDVYGAGKPPLYPEIDSPATDVKAKEYSQILQALAVIDQDAVASESLVFEPSLHFALLLLEANGRDDAGRLEPLEAGENKAAFRHIPAIPWSRYPYSVIVVPGAGPESRDVPLSSAGKIRLDIAVQRYRKGDAPLLMVSGAYVHPSQTMFNEAIEMKKYLIATFGIPEEDILVETQARHTTTNIRNANRLIYRYKIPFEKPALIVTDPLQSAYIESSGFAGRCKQEMSYVPYQHLKRLSPLDLEYLPTIESLHADAVDPLDP
jgi:hypothetical protein